MTSPERSDPTQCSGDPGPCPEHGYHAESLKQPDETAAPTPPADQNLRDRIAHVLLTTPRDGWSYKPGHEKWDHHKHGDRPGHNYAIYCALCTSDVDVLADAVLALLPVGADRAAGLREAIAVLDQRASRLDALSSSDFGEEARAVRELADAANDLRRMADETQQAGEGR